VRTDVVKPGAYREKNILSQSLQLSRFLLAEEGLRVAHSKAALLTFMELVPGDENI
jgi:hypothetical protein